MPTDKFLIAPLKSGAQDNVKPWLIMTDAFSLMRNLYTWRGSVKKRFGSRVMNGSQDPPFDQLFTRLRVNIGTTDGNGDFNNFAPGAIFAVGQMFSCGDELFTVNATGTPAAMLATGASTVHTFDTTTGQVDIQGSNANTDVFFYPAQPVMHLATYLVDNVNDEILIAFDTQFAYQFSYATGWDRIGTTLVSQWSGTNSNFFSTANYRGATSNTFLLFVTNNFTPDSMRYYNGATFVGFGTAGTTPFNAAGDFIETCKVIIPFKDRLLLMNVTENITAANQTFINRVRFSQNGSPIAADAWRQDIVGKGGFLEAPVKEAIIAAEFLKDRLIVFFEESTWELVYTGNEVLPFRFQQINSELGVESQNSVIPFDKVALGFGSNGIHACNGNNVDRIDDLIPNTIFDIKNDNQGLSRVAGIKDYWTELVYWSYPSVEEADGNNDTFPNRVLVYGYTDGTWSFNDDSITAFGNFQLQQTLTWQDIGAQWQFMDDRWADPSLRDRFKSVIAGNQEGYTFLVDAERNKNSLSLQITSVAIGGGGVVITMIAINHNLGDGDFVYITDIQASSGNMATANILNGRIFSVSTTGTNTFTINTGGVVVTGVYTGGGVLTRVSRLSLITKQYNFYNQEGTNISVNQVDFLVDKTENGEIDVAVYPSTSNRDILEDGDVSGALVGTGVLETTPYALVPLEATQDRFWHSIYFNAMGENIQLQLLYNDDQITDPDIAFSDFQLNAFLIYATKINQFGG